MNLYLHLSKISTPLKLMVLLGWFKFPVVCPELLFAVVMHGMEGLQTHIQHPMQIDRTN